MAHVGKFYKLQFRRDLAATSNNNDGYPEAFGISMEVLDGSLGHLISGHQYTIVNLLMNNQPPMVWRSGSILVGGTPIEITASVDPPQQVPDAIWTVTIKHAVTGYSYFEITLIPLPLGSSFSVWQFFTAVPTHETTEIHRLGGGIRAGARALGWNSYNP